MTDLYPAITAQVHAGASLGLIPRSSFMSSPLEDIPAASIAAASDISPLQTALCASSYQRPEGSGRGSGDVGRQDGHHDDSDFSNRVDFLLSPDEVRELVRLLQCPICSRWLRSPVTLPCGRTLCKQCLPETRPRANISYPASEHRRQGLQCPFTACGRDHAAGDCSVDVTLAKVLSQVVAELESRCELMQQAETPVLTCLVAQPAQESGRVHSPNDASDTPSTLFGGRLLSTFLLAENGQQAYNAQVSYLSQEEDVHRELDLDLLAKIKELVRAEMDCQVCYALYYDAVTTPCGHTFCRSCLQRVLDHATLCPICRRQLTIQPMVYRDATPTNRLIGSITTRFWSNLLDARKQTILAEGPADGNDEYDIAVFVCTLSFPLMPTFLHVFEPRYRLMIRRALEADRVFGMVPYLDGAPVEFGTLLRIINLEFFPDGRSLVETAGVSRFRITHHGVKDGYMVAKITNVIDIGIIEEEEIEAQETRAAGEEELRLVEGGLRVCCSNQGSQVACNRFPATPEEINSLPTMNLMAFAADFVTRMRAHSVRWLTTRMLAIYGECPRDPAVFAWWFANMLPVRESEKYRLLSTTSVRERLKICCRWIFEWERSQW